MMPIQQFGELTEVLAQEMRFGEHFGSVVEAFAYQDMMCLEGGGVD
jgi:hypothetical protein